MNIEDFERSRGFEPEELSRWGIHLRGDEVIIPTLGRGGAWYERTYQPGRSPKYMGPKGASPHLYNPLGLGPQADEVWIAEGEFDCLSLLTVGAPAVGVLGAGNFNTKWALLYEQARIVIALDPDEAGNSAADKMANLWQPGQTERFDSRRLGGYDDLNDWFKADRKGFMRAVLEW